MWKNVGILFLSVGVGMKILPNVLKVVDADKSEEDEIIFHDIKHIGEDPDLREIYYSLYTHCEKRKDDLKGLFQVINDLCELHEKKSKPGMSRKAFMLYFKADKKIKEIKNEVEFSTVSKMFDNLHECIFNMYSNVQMSSFI